MDKTRVEVMFWNGNEAIHWGSQTRMIFKEESEVEPFLDMFSCEDCTEVTVDVYIGNECINRYGYDVEKAKTIKSR